MIQKKYYKTKDYCKVTFNLQIEKAETVEILGLGNDWQHPVVMKRKKDGSFYTAINLPKNSTHEFKYLVNKHQWMNEPEADNEILNMYGGTNSVIHI